MSALTMRSRSKVKAEKEDQFRGQAGKSADANCVVAKGTRIEGDFSSTESIRLDGLVVGQLKCERRLVIGDTGTVEGKVTATEAVVMGHVKGDVHISGTLHLMPSARIEGDIHAKFLKVDPGAAYMGKCFVGE